MPFSVRERVLLNSKGHCSISEQKGALWHSCGTVSVRERVLLNRKGPCSTVVGQFQSGKECFWTERCIAAQLWGSFIQLTPCPFLLRRRERAAVTWRRSSPRWRWWRSRPCRKDHVWHLAHFPFRASCVCLPLDRPASLHSSSLSVRMFF